MQWLGKLLFPKYERGIRRKNMRFLGLALLVAMIISVLIGALLYFLNRQGRI